MVCNGYVAGRIVVSQSLAITYKMYVQQPTKIFCNFMQKRLAKNIRRDYPSPYAAVRRNEDGIQKGVYNGVLFIKGNLAVGRIHFRNSQKMEEIVKHQKKKEKCQRLLDTNEILLHLDFCRFPLYT